MQVHDRIYYMKHYKQVNQENVKIKEHTVNTWHSFISKQVPFSPYTPKSSCDQQK